MKKDASAEEPQANTIPVNDLAPLIRRILFEVEQIDATRQQFSNDLEAMRNLSKSVIAHLESTIKAENKALSERLENDLTKHIQLHTKAATKAEDDYTTIMLRLSGQAEACAAEAKRLRELQTDREQVLKAAWQQAEKDALGHADQSIQSWLKERGRQFEEQKNLVRDFLDKGQAFVKQQAERETAADNRMNTRFDSLTQKLQDRETAAEQRLAAITHSLGQHLSELGERISEERKDTEHLLKEKDRQLDSLQEQLNGQNIRLEQAEKALELTQAETAELRELIKNKRGIFW